MTKPRGIATPRWLVLESGAQHVIAMLRGTAPRALAARVARTIADSSRATVVLAKERRGMRRNPITLVHGGYAQSASFHLVTQHHAPIADLYVGHALALKIAHTVATDMGIPLQLYKHRGAAFKLTEESHEVVRNRRRARKAKARTNPTGAPVKGEVWTTLAGGRCKVLEATRTRVHVLHMESGNREWIERADFLASYRLKGRRNPIARSIDRRSIRTVKRGKSRVLLGCPKGKYRPRARGRRKCATSMRKVNPRPKPHAALVKQARATSEMWNEYQTTHTKHVAVASRRIPPVVVQLGEALGIQYRSRKYAGGPDNPSGKLIDYTHRFKSPRPILATDPAARQLYLVGGNVKVTPDGLVN